MEERKRRPERAGEGKGLRRRRGRNSGVEGGDMRRAVLSPGKREGEWEQKCQKGKVVKEERSE